MEKAGGVLITKYQFPVWPCRRGITGVIEFIMAKEAVGEKKYDFWQENNDTKIGVIFRESTFLYYISDRASKGEFVVPYLNLEGTVSELRESNEVYKHYGLYCAAVAAIYLPISFFINTSHLKVVFSPIFLVAAIILFFLYKRSQAIYGVLRSREKTIYLIKTDPNYEKIVNMLLEKRRAAFRKIYLGTDNVDNNQEALDKYNWLLEQKIISEAEYRELLKT